MRLPAFRDTVKVPNPLKNRMRKAIPPARNEAEAMLREIAFVLKMSRQILEEMNLAEQAVAAR